MLLTNKYVSKVWFGQSTTPSHFHATCVEGWWVGESLQGLVEGTESFLTPLVVDVVAAVMM